MNREEAKNLVVKTFEQSFDESEFVFFIKNLLNDFDESKAQTWSLIPESYRGAIKSYKRIGQYTDKNKNVIDVLSVNVKRDNTLERARSLQRNFIARHLKQRNHEAALVAFYADDYQDWRFSLVMMELNLTKTKVEIELSPAKRYSFLVGVSERSHTAQNQFVNLLSNKNDKHTLSEIEEAFNIETVTKEFFLEYRDLFIRTKNELDKVLIKDGKVKEEFEKKDVDTVNFSKKLLGQIVFLYFLQKKGWFGVPRDAKWGEGSKHFLRELFQMKHREYHNFFNEIIEPLFYEALRVGDDRKHLDYYYSHFNCRIPFLNGGLFDPICDYDWVHTDITLPNELFSNKNKTAAGDNGDGILDIFDRYNFTVIEDEPLEKEVAIDPELLGKAYEKFNAIRPDNFDEYLKVLKSGKKGEENKFNKQYGVYYTPREIVHYMCRESLINYLASEYNPQINSYEKLGSSQLSIVSTTSKDGQLELEAEHKSSPTISKKDIEILINYGELFVENETVVELKGKETDTYYYKLPESIRKNAKLIDDNLAEILMCDPAVGSGAFPVGMMHEIVSTRNLLSIFIKDNSRSKYLFKRECIERSLYGVDIDSGAVEIARLRLWLSLVVDEDNFKEIKPLPNLDYKIVKGNSLIGFPENWKSSISEKIENLKNEYFIETHPTVKKDLKDEIDKHIKNRLENSVKNFGYIVNFDFKTFFSEVFHSNDGFDIVIANPPYLFGGNKGITDQEKKTFKKIYFSGSKKINLFSIFIEKGTKLLKREGFLCYIVPNTLLRVTSYSNIREHIIKKTKISEIVDLDVGVFENVTASTIIIFLENTTSNLSNKIIIRRGIENPKPTNILPQKAFDSKGYIFNIFSSPRNKKIIDNLKINSVPLGDLSKFIRFGVVITNNINKVVGKRKVDNNWKPFLEGNEIGAYNINYKGRYLHYKKNLLHRSRTSEIFETNKILIQRITGGRKPIKAAFDTNQFYNKESIINLILLDNNEEYYKYILGILNSSLINWFYNNNYTNESKLTVNLSKEYLSEIPMKILARDNLQCEIIRQVNSILTAKRQNPQANAKQLEDQIDLMVYKLYNLNYEEVKIIDPNIGEIISEEEYSDHQFN
jgi:type I restriction-modification system DNA methylase subunit